MFRILILCLILTTFVNVCSAVNLSSETYGNSKYSFSIKLLQGFDIVEPDMEMVDKGIAVIEHVLKAKDKNDATVNIIVTEFKGLRMKEASRELMEMVASKDIKESKYMTKLDMYYKRQEIIYVPPKYYCFVVELENKQKMRGMEYNPTYSIGGKFFSHGKIYNILYTVPLESVDLYREAIYESINSFYNFDL